MAEGGERPPKRSSSLKVTNYKMFGEEGAGSDSDTVRYGMVCEKDTGGKLSTVGDELDEERSRSRSETQAGKRIAWCQSAQMSGCSGSDSEESGEDEEFQQLKLKIAAVAEEKRKLKRRQVKDRLKAELAQSTKELEFLKKEGLEQTILISDSIAKHVTGVDGLVVEAFPGRTISGLTAEVVRNKHLQGKIKESDLVILHVGTNDIYKLSFEEFPGKLHILFSAILDIKASVKLTYSAILPRPVDFHRSKHLVIKANNRIRKFCKYRKIGFLHTFRPFVSKNGEPHRHLYAIRDGGLHLNFEGSSILSKFYMHVINSRKGS